MRRAKFLAAAFVASAAALIPIGSATGNHHPCVGHPSDPSVACEEGSHRTIGVCDRHEDGHKTYARVVLQFQRRENYILSQYDSYGGNCYHETYTVLITEFAVCVQYEGCSGWKQG